MRPSFSGPSRPDSELLQRYAPAQAWELAAREARRSPMGTYGTGAVLLGRDGEIISNGCAHPERDRHMITTHAERHCLQRASHADLREAICLVYTVSSRSGGCSWTSRPCSHCARSLVSRGVAQAIYPARDLETGEWFVEVDCMDDVMENSSLSDGVFARNLAR